MKTAKLIVGLSLAIFAFTAVPSAAVAADAQTLQKAVLALKHQPANDQLRIKVIKLAQQLRPAPAVPSRARRYIEAGAQIRNDAEGMADYQRAVIDYRAAISDAPWWGEGYLEASDALQDAGLYDEAIKDLNFYILTNPGDAQVKDAKEKIKSAKAAKQYEEEAEQGG